MLVTDKDHVAAIFLHAHNAIELPFSGLLDNFNGTPFLKVVAAIQINNVIHSVPPFQAQRTNQQHPARQEASPPMAVIYTHVRRCDSSTRQYKLPKNSTIPKPAARRFNKTTGSDCASSPC
ncbi:MAG: hypothetical protein GPOALKHO_001963 [Sodalis sp.]|nr:MAG: hypothetical protein GPOALKHO_001963 [Sodalis sp.]